MLKNIIQTVLFRKSKSGKSRKAKTDRMDLNILSHTSLAAKESLDTTMQKGKEITDITREESTLTGFNTWKNCGRILEGISKDTRREGRED